MDLVLHIGDQKNGSTTIQHWLKSEKDRLAQDKIWLPTVTKLGVYDALLSAHVGVARFRKGLLQQMGASDAEADALFVQRFEDECAEATRDGFQTCVLSFEGLMWLSQERIQRLGALFDRLFNVTKIVCFIRRQDKKLISGYKTRLQNGGSVKTLDEVFETPSNNLNYFEALSNWRAIYPERNRFRIFLTDEVKDTAKCLYEELPGISWPYAPPKRVNTGVSGLTQQIMLHANQGKISFESDVERAKFRRLLGRSGPGAIPPLAPSPDRVRSALAHFAESNEALRREYFPERDYLFAPLNDHPADAAPRPAISEDLVHDVASLVLFAWRAGPQGAQGFDAAEDEDDED